MLRFWLPTWTMSVEGSILNSSTSLLSTKGMRISMQCWPSSVRNVMGLASEYTLAGSSSPYIRRAISLSFASPRSSVRIMGQYFISIGSKALWMISMFWACSSILSLKNSESPASSG